MEAMQRAQVERERALAEKERAVTDAQVAMQRNHVEIVIALLDRATGGKPQDPVAVLEQHVKLQKVIERQAPRNAGLLMAPMSDENQEGGKPHRQSRFAGEVPRSGATRTLARPKWVRQWVTSSRRSVGGVGVMKRCE
jgi:hypothetical protein